jgi:hypothetical protein
MEIIGQSVKLPVGCMALRVDLDVVEKNKASAFPGS